MYKTITRCHITDIKLVMFERRLDLCFLQLTISLDLSSYWFSGMCIRTRKGAWKIQIMGITPWRFGFRPSGYIMRIWRLVSSPGSSGLRIQGADFEKDRIGTINLTVCSLEHQYQHHSHPHWLNQDLWGQVPMICFNKPSILTHVKNHSLVGRERLTVKQVTQLCLRYLESKTHYAAEIVSLHLQHT